MNKDTVYSSVQLRSHVRFFVTPMDCSMPGLPVHHQLPEFTQTHVHWVGEAIQPSISSSVVTFSTLLQSFPASGSFPMSQLFASGGQSIRHFSFSISPSSEYSGLISFRKDWLDLLTVQFLSPGRGTMRARKLGNSMEMVLSHRPCVCCEPRSDSKTVSKRVPTWAYLTHGPLCLPNNHTFASCQGFLSIPGRLERTWGEGGIG